MVEAIAEKEISKDPLEFIKRENFQVNDDDHFSSDNEEMGYPRPLVVSEHHESRDETENEYHSHEKAIATQIVRYKERLETHNDVPSSPRGISPEGILSREEKLKSRGHEDEEEKLPIPDDLHDQLLGEELQSKTQPF